jgi:7-cyano-7-deazaguanine reductase
MPTRTKQPKFLGKAVRGSVAHLDPVPAPDGLDSVTMTSDEVVALGPVNRAPDIYTVRIEYQPGKWLIESKSLKLWLWKFHDQEVFAEQIAVDIRDEVVATIRPKWCRVTTTQKARGGITIESVSSYRAG